MRRARIALIRARILLLGVVAVAGCHKTPAEQQPTEAERERALLKAHGRACLKGKYERCGDILFMECDASTDGDSFYVRVSDGQTISSCGGACWHPRGEPLKLCQTMCPPPEWKCE